jgi:hypothetical protein
MKNILSLAVLMLGYSCTSGQNVQKDNTPLDSDVIAQIKNHYHKEHGKGTKKEEIVSDSTIDITYSAIPKSTDDYGGFLINIIIPKKPFQTLYGATPTLRGDLNRDKNDELVVSVHTEGGGTGGNGLSSQDIFVFERKNNKYVLLSFTPDAELSNCPSGYFRATSIHDGLLIGASSCYKDDDPRCCPTLNFETSCALKNGKLKYQSQKKLPDTPREQ